MGVFKNPDPQYRYLEDVRKKTLFFLEKQKNNLDLSTIASFEKKYNA